jgi:hypothetical protein
VWEQAIVLALRPILDGRQHNACACQSGIRAAIHADNYGVEQKKVIQAGPSACKAFHKIDDSYRITWVDFAI